VTRSWPKPTDAATPWSVPCCRSSARRPRRIGRRQSIFYQLYVLIDIYSRFNPSWIVSPVEDSLLAKDFIAEAIDRNGVTPHTVHADRGTSMTSKPVSALLADLGVTRSHSRPDVSDDCEYQSMVFGRV